MASPDNRPGLGTINQEDFLASISPQTGENSSLTREQRIKHHVAMQFALGSLADLHVTAVRYRLRDEDWIDANDPSNDITVDPAKIFSSPEEFASLVGFYRSELTTEQRDGIDLEDDQKAWGRQRQEEIWAMEISARDRKLEAERERLAAETATPIDVFVSEGLNEERAA